MSKKILYLDMDGVVADFRRGIIDLAPEMEAKELVGGEEYSLSIDEVCYANPDIYQNLPVIPGAIDAVAELQQYFEIYFLSTAMWSLPSSYTGKRLWIEEKFGEMAKKRLILTHRKDLMRGDFLVDDRTHNGAAQFKGEHIHFGTEKFPDWEATTAYLIGLCD